MQLLLIHSDYMSYEAKKSTPVAEDIDELLKTGRMDDNLTAFVAVESVDEKDPEGSIKKATETIREVMSQVNTNRVMLYPYAHLSSDLASPKAAVSILRGIEELMGADLEVKGRLLVGTNLLR